MECRATPICLYRIAESGLRVASESGEKSSYGFGGAVDGTGRAEALPDVGEAGAEGRAAGRVVEEAESFGGNALGREVFLNEFGNDRAPGDEIDHAEVGGANERLCEEGSEGSDAVDDNHGSVEEGGFDGSRAAGNDGCIGGRQGVIGLVFDDANSENWIPASL